MRTTRFPILVQTLLLVGVLHQAGTANAEEGNAVRAIEQHLMVSIANDDGEETFIETNKVPLVPDSVCYQWSIKVEKQSDYIEFKEVFSLPAPPRSWGGVDGNEYSPTVTSQHRKIAITERFTTVEDGWLSNGWCVTEGDPEGIYKIEVFAYDQLLGTFEFEAFHPSGSAE